jgi:hydrogenase nickel incorporation protein HypB
MVTTALDSLKLDEFDLVFVENIGNLICPVEFGIGSDLQAMILGVPEGDDKISKYPVMF